MAIIGMAPWGEAAARLRKFVAGEFRYFNHLGIGHDIVAVENGIRNPVILAGLRPLFDAALKGQRVLALEREAVLAKIREQRELALAKSRALAATEIRTPPEAQSRRHDANVAARAEANRQRSQGAGSGTKQGTNGKKK